MLVGTTDADHWQIARLRPSPRTYRVPVLGETTCPRPPSRGPDCLG
jgi:hypothetical protein